jgi:hypothetical protein
MVFCNRECVVRLTIDFSRHVKQAVETAEILAACLLVLFAISIIVRSVKR